MTLLEIHEYDVYEVKNSFRSVIDPPIGQFPPNLAQSLWMTSGTTDRSFSLTEI